MYPVLGSDWTYQLGYHWYHASGIPLGLCIYILFPPLGGHLWFFIQHEERLIILWFILIWIILWGLNYPQVNQVSQHCARTHHLVLGLHEWATFILALFMFPLILGQCSVHGPMKDLNVLFYNFCHQGRANICPQDQIHTQSKVIIGVSCGFISKHYPFKPFKLTKLANVWRTQAQGNHPKVSLGFQT